MAKISRLPESQPLLGDEELPVVQGGAMRRVRYDAFASPIVAATKLLRDQAADLVRPENVFFNVDLATAEAQVAEGTAFKIADSVAQNAIIYRRTAAGSDPIYEEPSAGLLDAIDRINGRLPDGHHAWNPADQGKIRTDESGTLWGNVFGITADQIIDDLMEPMRAAHPDYITRTLLGQDESGVYDIWRYVFEPENYDRTIILSTGVHGGEVSGILAITRLMWLIANEWQTDPQLAFLRNRVRIIYMPCCCPWGVNHRSLTVANALIPSRVARAEDFIIYNQTADAPPLSKGTPVVAEGEGEVRLFQNFRDVIATRGGKNIGEGRTFRASLRFRTTVDADPHGMFCGFFLYAADGTYMNAIQWSYRGQSVSADGWTEIEVETTSQEILSAFPAAAYVRAGFAPNSAANNSSSGGSMEVSFLKFADVTESFDGRVNFNGVDVNRNAEYRFELYPNNEGQRDYKGPAAWSEVEAQYVRDTILAYPEAVSYVDFHNFGSSGNDARNAPIYVAAEFPDGSDFIREAQAFAMESESDRPTIQRSYNPSLYTWAASRGMYASNPEWGDALYGTVYSNESFRRQIKFYGNLVMAYARAGQRWLTKRPDRFWQRLSWNHTNTPVTAVGKSYTEIGFLRRLIPVDRPCMIKVSGAIDASLDGAGQAFGTPRLFQSGATPFGIEDITVTGYTAWNESTKNAYFELYSTVASSTDRTIIPIQGEFLVTPAVPSQIADPSVGLFVKTNADARTLQLWRYRLLIEVCATGEGDHVYEVYSADGMEGADPGAGWVRHYPKSPA